MQYTPKTLFGGLSVEEFLRDYWQKKPLLVRQAFPGFESPVEPDELAGLACEEGINARLVMEMGGSRPWEVRYGPFDDDSFADLPESHWTLLVMDVEKYLPELREVLEPFRFMPDWRIDDLMISYAVDQGSVGPHTDQYDVFLIQAKGKRHWMIGDRPVENETLVEGLDQRILAEFTSAQDWVLEPGDMLYLPPGFAHHGVAQGECMTYSVGFRAPSYADLVSGIVEARIEQLDSHQRYADPDLVQQAHPAEVSPAAIAKVRKVFEETLALDDVQLGVLFAKLMTDKRLDMAHFYPQHDSFEVHEFAELLGAEEVVNRNMAVRMAYVRSPQGLVFCADGKSYELPANKLEFVQMLCDNSQYEAEVLLDQDEDGLALLTALYNQGCLLLEEDFD